MNSVNEGMRAGTMPVVPQADASADSSMLKKFFIGELKDIYWAEQKLIQAIPMMAEASSSDALRQLFEKHLGETRMHVKRLEDAFVLLGVPAEAVKCEAMAGITEEGEGIIRDTQAGTSTRDAGLILAAQKVEHYEISTYGGLAQMARVLGLMPVAGLLEATLDEEKGADKMLSLAAASGINRTASTEGMMKNN